MKVMLFALMPFLPISLFCESFEDQLSLALKNNEEIQSPYFETDNPSTEQLKAFFDYMDSFMKTNLESGENFYPTKSLSSPSPLYSINLPEIKNKYLKTSLIFKTSKGTIVHVSASRAMNCPDLSNECSDKEKFFIVLTAQNGGAFFIRAMEIVNLGFIMSGSKTVVIDGERYTAKIYANATDPGKSKLKINGPSGEVMVSYLNDISDAIAAKAVDIKLSRSYKLIYGSEIVQTGEGNVKTTGDNVFLLMPLPISGASEYFLLKESLIKPSGTVFPSMERKYFFKIVNNNLEIYGR